MNSQKKSLKALKEELTKWETKRAFHLHEWQCAKHKGNVLRDEIQDWFEKLPEEMEVFNTDDDYLTFRVEAKDKDDVKYYKRKGFN